MDSIMCELQENIDKMVTIYLTSTCLTGILVGVSEDACKIICRNNGRSRSRITVCRLCEIQAVTIF